MPILDIEIVLESDEQLNPDIAPQIADRTAEIFGSGPGGNFVKVRTLDRVHYAENGGGPQEGVYPVYVSVLKVKLPPATELQQEISGLTAAIAEVTARPEKNVHITYLPAGAGRVSFGGRLIT